MIVTYIGFPDTWEQHRDFIDNSFMLLQQTYGRILKVRYKKIGQVHLLQVYFNKPANMEERWQIIS